MQVTKEEYQSVGSKALIQQLEKQLHGGGLNPYCIPVGGSTPLGARCPCPALRYYLHEPACSCRCC